MQALWYKDHAGIFDDRHMNQRGHVAMGDLLVLYLREQLCELDRTFQFRRLLVEHTSPTDEAIPDSYINTLTVPLGLQERWTSEANTRGPLSPRCRSVVSKKDPLVPKHNHGWDLIKRNDKVVRRLNSRLRPLVTCDRPGRRRSPDRASPLTSPRSAARSGCGCGRPRTRRTELLNVRRPSRMEPVARD
jgi:hypothetical protein